jgi:adenine-specific DNA-methyltransferase
MKPYTSEMDDELPYEHPISTGAEFESLLVEGDALDKLDGIPDGSCQLVITSPPYNIRKEYERDKRLSLEQYLAWLKPIILKLCAKVSDEGHICWQTGNFIENGEVFPLDLYFYQILKDAGFKLRNRIIWHFNFGLHAQNRFSGRYETILWFSKTDNYTFNLDPVRVPQAYPGKRHSSTKGDRAGKPSGNPKGKNPSDFWTFDAEQAFLVSPIWDFPNVKANHPEKTSHPCQFPSELVERCILALTQPGDLILDPFLGSGTTAIAAMVQGRSVIGIDKDPRYIALAKHRLELLAQNELPRRPLGKPVRIPRAGESVARKPTEWLGEQTTREDECDWDNETLFGLNQEESQTKESQAYARTAAGK